MVEILISDYEKIDMTEIAKKMADGELVEAYVAILNIEADFIGNGGTYNSDEYAEIKSMKQHCEHWIAQKVLSHSGWKGNSVTRYFKLENKKGK